VNLAGPGGGGGQQQRRGIGTAAERDGNGQGGREPLQWRKGGIGQGANALRLWCR
jgi:hypothetical protein